MRCRPILFNAAMVKAILDGRKTQTRRVVKFPAWMQDCDGRQAIQIPKQFDGFVDMIDVKRKHVEGYCKCPYGVGDRLYVREEHYRFGHWEPVKDVRTKIGRQKWKFVAESSEVRYADNAPEAFRKGMHKETPDFSFWHKRLARFMPRWASRITLEIDGVRVERLQDISNSDCVAEGIEAVGDEVNTGGVMSQVGRLNGRMSTVRQLYSELWQSAYGPGSWAANPWVWAISFRRVEQ